MTFQQYEFSRSRILRAHYQSIIDAINIEKNANILLAQAKNYREQANLLFDASLSLSKLPLDNDPSSCPF